MKKIIIILVLAMAGCLQPDTKKPVAATKQKQTKTSKYICVMDKDVCADKPGVCRKCGMKLVAKDADN